MQYTSFVRDNKVVASLLYETWSERQKGVANNMERLIGTVSRGVRAPIIRQGDDIAAIVVDSVVAAAKSSGFELNDRDVVAVTEAVVARAQGNYASIDQIAKDVKSKFYVSHIITQILFFKSF